MNPARGLLGIVLAVVLPLARVEAVAGPGLPHHALRVRLDPHARTLAVHDSVEFSGGQAAAITLGAAWRVVRASLDGSPVAAQRGEDVQRFDLAGVSPGTHRFDIEYHGMAEPSRDTDHRGTLGALPPMADERGSYLPAGSGWYPQLGDASFTYTLHLALPPGQRGIAPGRIVEEHAGDSGYRACFTFMLPIDGIDLMTGPYTVDERVVHIDGREIRLRTWFHPEIAGLAAGYLDSVETYIRRYDAQIGAYPFDRFDVVSSPLPTGFGMPGLTYLGIDVLRLPFIRTTSLGHEVLHNWWGNGVRADYTAGNWAEGLTTFMADYAYKEDAGAGAARAMRLEWLRDFAAVPAHQDMPLRAFTARTHGTSQIVGYNKAAFVFFMLRDAIGAPAFQAALRNFWQQHRFATADWTDLQHAFEAASGRDLAAFFAQWLDRSGAPRIAIERAGMYGDAVHVKLAQSQPAYVLEVPLAFETHEGLLARAVLLDVDTRVVVLTLPSPARSVALDPDLRLFRVLSASEIPPILRNVMVDPATRLIVAAKDPSFTAAAKALAARLLDAAPGAPNADDHSAPLLLIGADDVIAGVLAQRKLPQPPPEVAGKGSARVWVDRLPSGQVVGVVAARNAAALASLERALPHYGRQGWLVFENGKAIAHGAGTALAPVVPVHPE